MPHTTKRWWMVILFVYTGVFPQVRREDKLFLKVFLSIKIEVYKDSMCTR